MANTDFTNGRTMFTFTASTQAGSIVLSFAGDANAQVHLGPDNVVQPIDAIDAALSGHPYRFRAVGQCRYSNPYRGVAPILCAVETAVGHFGGDFMSDGREPEFLDLTH